MKKINELTICISAYNRDNFLKNAVASIERQTALPYELVICDNGASKFAQNYRPPMGHFKYRYCQNQINTGIFGNWNRGINEARTRLFTILCDDDWLVDTWVADMYNFWQKQQKPISIVCQYSVMDQNKKLLETAHHHYQKEETLGPKKIFSKIPFIHCILFDHASIPLGWSFNEKQWGLYSDLIAFIQLAQHKPLMAIDASLSIVRNNPLQASKADDFNIRASLKCLTTLQHDGKKLLGDNAHWVNEKLYQRAIKLIARDFAYGNYTLAKKSLHELKSLNIYNTGCLAKILPWWCLFFISRLCKYSGLRPST